MGINYAIFPKSEVSQNRLHSEFGKLVMQSQNLPEPQSDLNCIKIASLLFLLWGVTRFLGSLKISQCEERRLKDTQNLKCEDRRFQNCLVLKAEADLATKPTKPEDRIFAFLTGKI